MDFSDEDLERRAEADRRVIDPPIEVQAASWSPGATLDWWCGTGWKGGAAYAVQTAVNGGLELLIFV